MRAIASEFTMRSERSKQQPNQDIAPVRAFLCRCAKRTELFVIYSICLCSFLRSVQFHSIQFGMHVSKKEHCLLPFMMYSVMYFIWQLLLLLLSVDSGGDEQ